MLELLLLGMASCAVVLIWLQPNGIFDDTRDWLTVWLRPATEAEHAVSPSADTAVPIDTVVVTPRMTWLQWLGERLAYLINCPLCSTTWVVLGLILLGKWHWGVERFTPLVLYWFAGTYLAYGLYQLITGLERQSNWIE